MESRFCRAYPIIIRVFVGHRKSRLFSRRQMPPQVDDRSRSVSYDQELCQFGITFLTRCGEWFTADEYAFTSGSAMSCNW